MNSIGTKALALLAIAAAHLHAIFGIGGQWAPAPGLEVKKSEGALGSTGVSLNQGGVDGLQGFGVKIWLDFLPFIDIEATSNIQMGYYDLSVSSGTDTAEVPASVDVPFVEEKPAFARIASDLSILYPFLKFPPVVSVVKLYAGGGITHVLATEVMNKSFAEKVVASKPAADVDSPDEVAEVLKDAIIDEGLTSGVGFHLMAGAKAKPPIIPLAVFANIKYHFLSSQPDAVDGSSMTLELGGALAF